MIRNIRNLISSPKILKQSISRVKSVETNFEVISKGVNRIEYHNYNVIREPNINRFYNKVVINEIKDFNNNNEIELLDSYVKWSRSNDSDYQVYPINHWNGSIITCVFSDNKIKYKFYSHEIETDVLDQKGLLIFDSNVAVKFYNQGNANLLFFSIYSPTDILCSDMLNVYKEEKEGEDEEQLRAMG